MRTRVAYHEAGHAVAALSLGRPFQYASIESDEHSHGHVRSMLCLSGRFGPDGEMVPADRALIDDEVTILHAGYIAEMKHTGRYNHADWTCDRETATELALYVVDGEALDAYLGERRLVAESIVEANWARVEAVAAALLQCSRLSYDDVRGVECKTARSRTS